MAAHRAATKSALSPDQRVNWLRLIRTENIGPATFRRLINRFGAAEAAIAALPALSQNGGGTWTRTPSRAEAEDEIAATLALGGRFAAIGEPDYPELLRHIPAAPPMIVIKGGQNLNWPRSVAIVGARNASAAGQRMAALLAGDLADAGYLIVSGLARGIDAAAHKAALGTGTIAVLAGGLDRVYPAENQPLAEGICQNGGALITEMPLGWEPRARDFPRRNRLVSGLALGVVVIEAAKRSGSLITARLALEQNREVFAVPGSPLDPRAEGANALIQQGAALITGASYIIDILAEADLSRLPLSEDTDDFLSGTDFAADAEPGDDDRARLLSALSLTPLALDILIQQSGLGVATVHTILLELDIAGRLEWSGGQRVALRG